MRQHVNTAHAELSSTEKNSHMSTVEENARLLFTSPAYEQFTSKLLLTNGTNVNSKSGLVNDDDGDEDMPSSDFLNGLKENIKNEEDVDESDGMPVSYKEKQFLEDYMNSHSMAEEHYKDVTRKFKCHRCRVAFTNPRYLYAHNKTAQHRLGEKKALDTTERSKSLKCEPCNESFFQKNHLIVHNNSPAHLFKLKQLTQMNGDLTSYALPVPTSLAGTSQISIGGTSMSITNPLSASPQINFPNTANGNLDNDNGAWEKEGKYKPYKCSVCKVGYSNAPSLDIHMRSVGHKAKANKLADFAHRQSESQSFHESSESKSMGKQQAQLIADMIHQQATAQAASNTAASLYNLSNMNNPMAQLSLLQGLMPVNHLLPQSAQSALAAMSSTQLEQFESLSNMANMTGKDLGKLKSESNSSVQLDKTDGNREKTSMKISINTKPEPADKIVNMVIKQDGKIEPASELKSKPFFFDDKQSKLSPSFLSDFKGLKKEEELPPNFPHAPVISRPRGFMGRFKPQLHRSLLENFGFECVMHYNEEHRSREKEQKEEVTEDSLQDSDNEINSVENEKNDESCEVLVSNIENVKDEEMNEIDEDGGAVENEDKKCEEDKENLDLPELNKVKCLLCNKFFSNVWVLKNHEEDMHNNFVLPEIIEKFGKKFKEEWEKNLPKVQENEISTTPSTGSLPSPNPKPSTPTPEKPQTNEMPPPPPPPSQPQNNVMNFDMTQLLPLMGMNLLPMHLPMNLIGLSLQNSMMPSIMLPPGMDLPQGFLQQMQTQQMSPHLVDSNSQVNSQQHNLQVAAAAAAQQAQNQKRVRTRISDDQLKVLRQYFDINNSPSEEQINKMSDQTGLPQKVIKHWFRNTLFKERQRNKDSPYNFNNPPSTSIDLDEYDRTGKIPDVKVEPEEDEEMNQPSISTAENVKDVTVVKEETDSFTEKDRNEDQNGDCFVENTPLKIDLTPSQEPNEESNKKDQDSHSNTSSPSNMSSMPSTPTASAPATPTPMMSTNPLTPNPLNPNPLAFSLDAYAANMARLEAASFQSMGKRANRTRFTDYQIKTLQDYFERNAYPKDDELEHLSKILGLSARVIVVWFQNARQKARKIYENQPSTEITKEPATPFQRTPGLNYQCKKCNSVFQRYYELIKHQKTSCLSESNNNKFIPSMTEDDSSNYSFNSSDDVFHSDRNISSSSGTPAKDKELFPQTETSSSISPKITKTSPISGIFSSPALTSTSMSMTAKPMTSNPVFKCEKCTLTFPRFDMWQEHQKAHQIAPAIFTPFSSSSAFGMLQTLAHQEDSKSSITMAPMSTPNSSHLTSLSTPIPSGFQMNTAQINSLPTSVMSTSPSPGTIKRKTDSEDECGEQPRDKRLRTTILPEQLDYLYQQYQVNDQTV